MTTPEGNPESFPKVNEPSILGFIGLGTMGGRMCRNLARKSGKPVVGYDLVSERIADCAGAGVGAGHIISCLFPVQYQQ